jgi:fluoroacetyl-CoA thioesterase
LRRIGSAYLAFVEIPSGVEASVLRIVEPADTALSIGSGDVPVLATPRVVALCEEAAVKAVREWLEPAQTSVGTQIALDHIAPTAVGRRVRARAVLERADGKTLSFAIEASDGVGVVARGTHSRVIVDRERFVKGARDRA